MGAVSPNERVFLDAEMKNEVICYQMSTKSSHESERLKSYSHAKLQLLSAAFGSIFTDPRPALKGLSIVLNYIKNMKLKTNGT